MSLFGNDGYVKKLIQSVTSPQLKPLADPAVEGEGEGVLGSAPGLDDGEGVVKTAKRRRGRSASPSK